MQLRVNSELLNGAKSVLKKQNGLENGLSIGYKCIIAFRKELQTQKMEPIWGV